MYDSIASLNKLAVLACAVVCIIAGNVSQACAADPPKASAMVRGPIVAPKAEIEKLFGDGFWTEGPAVAPDGKVYFCDITMTFATKMAAGNVWIFDPESGRTTLFRSPSGMAAGIKFDANGDMVMTEGADHGGRAVIRTDMKTGRSVLLAGTYNGHPFNAPNDLDIDREGRVYFTDPRYFGDEPIEQPTFGVYRIDPNGTTKLILADVPRPNGIAISPDQKTLYIADHDTLVSDVRLLGAKMPLRKGTMRILAYDLAPDGSASNQRVIANYGDEAGADGIAIDRLGNLYAAVAAASRPGIRVYDPTGKEIAYIPVPERATNLALATRGGKTELYITATKSLYRIETLVPENQRWPAREAR